MTALGCPICHRRGWLTADGLTYHFEHEHSAAVVAETLAQVIAATPAEPKKPTTRCTKIGYPTEHAARTELVGTVIGRNRGKQKRRECRAYACDLPGCGQWHLTSQPERKPA